MNPSKPRAFWCLLTIFAFSSLSAADDFGWRGPDGKLVPDTECRKNSQGFAGLLLTTSDPGWKAKWNTPEYEASAYTEATTVRRAETVYTLMFPVNPKLDRNGQVNVRCDLKVTRPNGTVSIAENNVECLGGPLLGNAFDMRLAAPVVELVGEATDPIGNWQIDGTPRDVQRGVAMSLHTSFELLGNDSATTVK